MAIYLYGTFARGVANKTTGTKMTMFKTSFNMPVPNIFDSSAGWTQYDWPLNTYGTSTSLDLSGFQAGWEAIMCLSGVGVNWPDTGSVNISQVWKNPAGTTLFTNWPVSWGYNNASGFWTEYMLASNLGVAAWEITSNGAYTCTTVITGSYSTTLVQTVNVTNCPSTSTYNTAKVWVEWNDLRWTSAAGHLHTQYGTQGSSVWTGYAGKIWVNSSTNQLQWVGSDGYIYTSKYNFQQFASSFSNGAPGSVNAGTSQKGFLWMDNQFGQEHIGYIGNDGYKWINMSGANPYANPPNSSSP